MSSVTAQLRTPVSLLRSAGPALRPTPSASAAPAPANPLSRRTALLGSSAAAAASAGFRPVSAMPSTLPAGPSASVPTVKLSSGYDMPLIGLGTSGLSGDACEQAVRTALRLGFRHIDSAQMYGNEQNTGAALGEALSNGISREDLFIVTKLKNDLHAPDKVEPAVRESLKKLRVDYVDLLHIHWPFDPQIAPETWKAMEACVDKGLVRSIGISNFSPKKTDRWFGDARIQPAVNQVEVHCHWRNDRLLEHHKQKGIHVTAYAPMSSPATMASQGRKVPNLLTEDDMVQDISRKLGKTPAQVLLRWGLQHGTSVIPRSGSEGHQKEIIDTTSFELHDEDFKALNTKDYQLRYFSGEGLAIGEGKPYSSYQDLWDEEPNKIQQEFDYS